MTLCSVFGDFWGEESHYSKEFMGISPTPFPGASGEQPPMQYYQSVVQLCSTSCDRGCTTLGQ